MMQRKKRIFNHEILEKERIYLLLCFEVKNIKKDYSLNSYKKFVI